jgi:hypothetical protein
MSKQPVIDVHAHFYPAPYLALLKQHGFPADTVYSTADPRKPDDPGSRTQNCAIAPSPSSICASRPWIVRASMCTLSLPPPYAFARNGELLVKIARTFNDAASAAPRASRSPGRTRNASSARCGGSDQELERAARLPGIRGVGLGTVSPSAIFLTRLSSRCMNALRRSSCRYFCITRR